ncbi:Poly(A) RNA polymerase, mitochondrial [Anthophora plagiata]
MALVHRVNLNFNPLLGTYYCKCMINITRLKTIHAVKVQPKTVHDKNSTKFTTFEQMVLFRQNQARKTALVMMDSINMTDDVERFCMSYGRVLNIFPYYTKANKVFLLVEYETQNDVDHLNRNSVHRYTTGTINVITSLLLYRNQNHNFVKYKQPSMIKHYPYADFTVPTLTNIQHNLKQEKNVSQQMLLLYDTLKITDLNVRLRFFTAHQLMFYLSKLFTNISVVPFGSSVNGFGQLGCDLDLICRIKNNKVESDTVWKKLTFLSQRLPLIEREEQKQFLAVLSTILGTCIPGIGNIRNILEARVPIIKFFNMNTNMQCDLSCGNASALHMSELLYIYAELDWRVKPLVCTIRTWARNCNLTQETAGHWITNFSLTLLIMFYLQIKNILPSLHFIESIREQNMHKVLGQYSWFTKWKISMPHRNTENLQELLHGFFEYYSIFDFKTQAICIREGIVKAKRDNSPVYIYNPFDATLNVSRNITLVELSRLIDSFQIGLQILDFPEENVIVKLIKLEPCTYKSRNTSKALFLNVVSHGDKQNENNSDRDELKHINRITNENNTNVSANNKKSIIK